MKAKAHPTVIRPQRRRVLNDQQREIVCVRLGRGDKQADIARDLNVLPEVISRLCCEIRQLNPDLFSPHNRKRGNVAIVDPETVDVPLNLSSPEARVWAYIKKNSSLNTQRSYAADLRQAAELLGLNGIAELVTVQAAEVIKYFELLKARKLAGATISRKLSVLHTLLDREIRLAFRQPPNPVDPIFIKRPSAAPRSRLETLTGEEVRKVIQLCDDGKHIRDIRDAALLRVGFWFGLRADELAGMTAAKPDDWSQKTNGGFFVKSDGNWFIEVIGKGERQRVMPVCGEVIAAMERHLNASGLTWESRGPLWIPTRGLNCFGELTTRGIRRLLQSRCRSVGINKRISTHSMRKTAVSRLLDLGVDAERLRHFLGHSSLVVTQRYLTARNDLKTHAAHLMSY